MKGPWMHSPPMLPLKPNCWKLKVDISLAITSTLSGRAFPAELARGLCIFFVSAVRNSESDVPGGRVVLSCIVLGTMNCNSRFGSIR